MTAATGLTTGLTTGLATGLTTAAAAASPVRAIDVNVDKSQVRLALGDRFVVKSRIANSDAAATDPIVANLNVASLASGVYVDPEDWSSDRTRYLSPLASGASAVASWELHAVNTGSFVVYIGVLPNGPGSAGTGPLVVSQPVHVTVGGRQTLNAGGSLPVAIVVPILLGLAAGAVRYRIRRAS
jgi:hypothetical protein